MYRVHDIDELIEIGFDDYLSRDGLIVIEWANLILDIIPEDAIFVTLTKDLSVSEAYRIIEISFNEEKYPDLMRINE